MSMKINKHLKQQIYEIVYNAIKNNTLFEMALERRYYKDKVDDMFPEIIINWCLIHYCTLIGQTEYKKHWSDELYNHIRQVVTYSIKKNDSEKTRLKVFQEIWDERDLDDNWRIDLMIDLKFSKENIQTNTDVYNKVIEDFINQKDKLLNILLCRNKEEIKDYIYNQI